MDFDFTTETITPDSTGVLTFGGTQAVELPAGSTAQRPVTGLLAGSFRYNNSLLSTEFYNGTTWVQAGTVTSVALTAPSIFAVAGSPVTNSGTLALSLATQSANTHFAGPATGAAAAPTFRTISLAQNDLSDVVITSPTLGQVLTYNATTSKWINAGQAAGSYSGLISAWTLVSGTKYSAVVTHSLGTSNIVVQFYNATTNAMVVMDGYVVTDNNNITVFVNGGIPSFSVRVIIIANGSSIAAGGSTPSSILVQNQGVALTGTYTAINVSSGLTAVNSGGGVATITTNSAQIIRTLTWGSASFDSPNNSDWAVNALAPSIADPVNAALTVRQFAQSTEQGVGFLLPIPSNATNITFTFKGRAQTAPGAAAQLQLNAYRRPVASPTPAAVGAWVQGIFSAVTVPTNAFFQTYTQTFSLAGIGVTPGATYQYEITRNVSVAGNLTGNWLLYEIDVSFT